MISRLLIGLALFMATASLVAQPPIQQHTSDSIQIDSNDTDTTIVAVEGINIPMDSTLDWVSNLRIRLTSLLDDPLFEHSQLGLCVYDLDADSILFVNGADQRLRPASTQKLLTAVTALDILGGSYRFETALYYDGDIGTDSVLTGNLYIVGGMDPLFGRDDMQGFVQEILAKGIKQIKGEVYTDITLKDTLQWGAGWCWDDENPTLTPLLYNGHNNFMQVFMHEADEAGILLPSIYSAREVPSLAALIASRFHSMDQVLLPMLKESNNLFAECMFYQLGAQQTRPYPSAKRSAQAVTALLHKLQPGSNSAYVADGSGLSLYNYTTARLLVAALRYAWQNKPLYEHLYFALPIAATDGTLRRRMHGTKADYNIHAKTGTLEGVSSLAGYATASNGHMLAFAIINQGIRRTAQGHRFQNRLCDILCQ